MPLHLSLLPHSHVPPSVTPLSPNSQHISLFENFAHNTTPVSLSLSLTTHSHSLSLSSMAEHQPGPTPAPSTATAARPPRSRTSAAFIHRLQPRAPNSTQVIGFLTLVVSAGILLLLAGLTLAATVLALIFFTPLVLLSSPIWVPAGTVLFVAGIGFLSTCAIGAASLAALSWVYKYIRGRHPPGSDRVDYARSRLADTATHVKDYAREYSVYLQSKVKHAAPGA